MNNVTISSEAHSAAGARAFSFLRGGGGGGGGIVPVS